MRLENQQKKSNECTKEFVIERSLLLDAGKLLILNTERSSQLSEVTPPRDSTWSSVLLVCTLLLPHSLLSQLAFASTTFRSA